ncbi:unnamed protein product, partial [Nesidiocoris tenuis]
MEVLCVIYAPLVVNGHTLFFQAIFTISSQFQFLRNFQATRSGGFCCPAKRPRSSSLAVRTIAISSPSAASRDLSPSSIPGAAATSPTSSGDTRQTSSPCPGVRPRTTCSRMSPTTTRELSCWRRAPRTARFTCGGPAAMAATSSSSTFPTSRLLQAAIAP